MKESFDRLSTLLDGDERLVRAINYATNQRIDRRTERIEKTTEETGKDVKHIATSLNGRFRKSHAVTDCPYPFCH